MIFRSASLVEETPIIPLVRALVKTLKSKETDVWLRALRRFTKPSPFLLNKCIKQAIALCWAYLLPSEFETTTIPTNNAFQCLCISLTCLSNPQSLIQERTCAVISSLENSEMLPITLPCALMHHHLESTHDAGQGSNF